LLAMNPAINPNMIQPMMDIVFLRGARHTRKPAI
jgi:hypothetical protein